MLRFLFFLTWLCFLSCIFMLSSIALFAFEQGSFSMLPHPLSAEKIYHSPPVFSYCQRYFLYQGKQYECDSNLGEDAENLRPFIIKTPWAIRELDNYQKNRKFIRNFAYFGSAGILSSVFGMTLAKGSSLGTVLTYAGVLLLGGSMVSAYGLIHYNDVHLQKAVEYYNQENPKQPIQWELRASLHFY